MAKKDRTKTSPKSDERKAVASEGVDLQDIEDQIILIWEKNKGLILGGIGLIFAVFIGYQAFKYFQEQATIALQEGYREVDGSAEKENWAKEESGSDLSGFAFKELGDEAFSNGDLSTAEAHYRAAADSADVAVQDAAQIALAVTMERQGKTSEAKDLLQRLADDPEALNRAEAQYRLAQIAQSEGDNARARSLIDAIDSSAVFWKSRARALEASLPRSDA